MDRTTSGVMAAAVVLLAVVLYNRHVSVNPFKDININEIGIDKPILWVYLNSSDVNSRSWADFMDRSSRAINLPFLNLCYESIVKQNSAVYRVEVIGGLSDLAARMGGWTGFPETLQNPNTVIREPELNWIRSAVLAKWGGLWVSPATVCIKPFGPLPKKRTVFFGTDTGSAYASPSTLPALNVIWAPVPNHPLWVTWEKNTRERLNRKSGGSEFRNDEKSDLADALREFKNECVLMPGAELSRKGASLKRIELEDLLAAGTEGDIPFSIPSDTVYVPIPYPEILQRSAFDWFLRMSEDQIMNSDLVLSYFFRIK
jgi:hypothetical protein